MFVTAISEGQFVIRLGLVVGLRSDPSDDSILDPMARSGVHVADEPVCFVIAKKP